MVDRRVVESKLGADKMSGSPGVLIKEAWFAFDIDKIGYQYQSEAAAGEAVHPVLGRPPRDHGVMHFLNWFNSSPTSSVSTVRCGVNLDCVPNARCKTAVGWFGNAALAASRSAVRVPSGRDARMAAVFDPLVESLMNPYNLFKNDVERRKALDTRARYAAITVIALCASGTPSEQVMQWIQVIKVLFH